MTDLNKKLSESLKSVGESFRPPDIVEKQRIFLHRRRRRRMVYAGSTLAFGAAAVAAVLFVTSTTTAPVKHTEQPPAGELHPVITDVIPVGEGPSGIGVGTSGVWAANNRDATVSRIDPTSGQVTATVRVTPDPDDVAVGTNVVFISDEVDADTSKYYGSISKIDPQKNELIDQRLGFSDTRDRVDPRGLDMVADGNTLWAVGDAIRNLYAFDGMDENSGSVPSHVSILPGARPSDIALMDSSVWVYSPSTNQLFDVPHDKMNEVRAFDIGTLAESANEDIAASDGAVWLTQGGVLARIDARSGELTNKVSLRGNYAALAAGDGEVWAMSADSEDTSDNGWLTQIDPATGNPIGQTLTLGGKPTDIAVGAGAVWVTQNDKNTVARIELRSETAPTPEEGSAAT